MSAPRRIASNASAISSSFDPNCAHFEPTRQKWFGAIERTSSICSMPQTNKSMPASLQALISFALRGFAIESFLPVIFNS